LDISLLVAASDLEATRVALFAALGARETFVSLGGLFSTSICFCW
jgi:hypothetical protein